MGFSVYVTRPLPEGGLRLLEESSDIDSLEVNPDDRPLGRGEILRAVKGRDGILTILHDRIDEEVMAAGKRLRVISNYAAGLDNIDLEAAARRGVVVTNTPDILTDATADFTWALILGIARRVVEGERFTREMKYLHWGPSLLLGAAVAGKRLGIVGAGRIGTAVGLRALGFRMEVGYTSRQANQRLESEVGARRLELADLLEQSDFVTLHVPLTPETRGLIGEKEFGWMKSTAFLINTARGPVVVEGALSRALREGRLAGAALDVYEREPEIHPDLIRRENVILTPHAGSATEEARLAMATMACENLLKALLK
ncbi:MAG: D-glycerate dehydrogenase [Planctomycetota bacterium]|nr:D-glycerate dehydrogenase [Planctomycetota bacterium]